MATRTFPILLLFLATAASAAPESRVSPRDGMPQVLIPAGAFTMGVAQGEYGRDAESPAHAVYLDAYWIDRHEVTNEQFVRFLNERASGDRNLIYSYCNPDNPFCRIVADGTTCAVEPGYEKHPVCTVSREGARAYAAFVGRRLPTEAEWEKAARGGEARRYPWGDEWDPAHANTSEAGPRDTRPVGDTVGDRSPYGVWDMAGNAAEWVRDAWDPAFYIRSPSRNPVNDTDASRRGVARGGAWCLTEWDARTTSRQILLPSVMRRYVGFRCAETAPASETK